MFQVAGWGTFRNIIRLLKCRPLSNTTTQGVHEKIAATKKRAQNLHSAGTHRFGIAWCSISGFEWALSESKVTFSPASGLVQSHPADKRYSRVAYIYVL